VLNVEHKSLLHDIARQSIQHGLATGKPLDTGVNQYDRELQSKRATFVTLHRNKQLRGCIGILVPLRPLVEDVAYNAWAAAFSDNRFAPLQQEEFDDLEIHISILGSPEQINFDSEEDLLSKIHVGTDGLILEDGNHKGTFLPSVWKSLPDKKEFLNHLKQKASLSQNYWSDNISIKRYTVEEF